MPAFQPGNPGRAKGTPNKVTASVKEMILCALEDSGGVAYLQRQADENPQAFLQLVGKVLPLQITGDGGGALTIRVVTGVPEPETPAQEHA